MKRIIQALTIALVGCTTSSVFAQSMNVDFDMSNEEPESCFLPTNDYAAAGNAGHWNSINNIFGEMINPVGGLRDLNGDTTNAIVDYDDETAAFCHLNPDIVDINHRALLSDAWYLGYLGKFPDVITFQFTGLQNGTYEVITYAFIAEDASSITSIDVVGSPEGPLLSGGEWTGSPVEGVTHVVHHVDVTDGTITIPATKIAGLDNMVNGFQLTLIPPDCPADIDGNDNDVNVFDLLALLSAWGTNGAGAGIAAPTDVVDVFDLLGLLGAWGQCSN